MIGTFSTTSGRFSELLSAYEAEVDSQSHRDCALQLATWDDKLRDLKRSIRASSQLSPSERQQLLNGVRGVRADVILSSQWIVSGDPPAFKEGAIKRVHQDDSPQPPLIT